MSRPLEGLVTMLATWVRDEAFFAEIWMCDTDSCDKPAVVNWIDAEANPAPEVWPLPRLSDTDILACEDHYLPEREDRVAIVLPEPACNMGQTDVFGNASEGCRRPAGPSGGSCHIHKTLDAAGILAGGF